MREKRQKKNIGGIIDKRYFTKEELQQHDRELVKEVCEKITERYNLECKPITDEFGDTQYGYAMISAKDLKQFLDQIQKEFEV